jgi:uncharacterized protein YdeI (YjbR/CyaY-like superfamily)
LRRTPVVDVVTRARWRRWLERFHVSSSGIWLVVYKKGAAPGRLSLTDAVEEALCFGWIDGRLNTLDDQRFKLHLSPRRPGSNWAKINKERVRWLTRMGRMAPAGLAKVRAAKQDGSWSRLEPIDRMTVPGDLQASLRANRDALRNFRAFSDSSRRIILFWIQSAKRPETRRRRIAETVRLAAQNVKAAHGRPPPDRPKG